MLATLSASQPDIIQLGVTTLRLDVSMFWLQQQWACGFDSHKLRVTGVYTVLHV